MFGPSGRVFAARRPIMADARYRAVVERFESSRPGLASGYEMVVLRDIIPLDGGIIAGEQRLAHGGGLRRLGLTAGNLIEFAARCDAYDGDGRCIAVAIDDRDAFAAAACGTAASDTDTPATITFRLTHPGKPVKVAHRA